MSPAASKSAMECLNQIFQAEMAGVVRFLHYSFMVMGPNRIPIQKWLRDQANESIDHAVVIGEKITSLGGHPPMVGGTVEETNIHTVDQILRESLKFEEEGLALYKKLVGIATSEEDIALEELARDLVRQETEHLDEVRKMLKTQ